MRNAYKILVRKTREGSTRKSRRRWENNIRMDLMKIGWDVDWMNLAQDRNSGELL
jgi:hypothetical protein